MQKKKLLIIGLVWPEPTSSAAGLRMVQLIHFFLSKNYEINFACAASKSEYSHELTKLGVKEELIKLNNESFNHYVKDLKGFSKMKTFMYLMIYVNIFYIIKINIFLVI